MGNNCCNVEKNEFQIELKKENHARSSIQNSVPLHIQLKEFVEEQGKINKETSDRLKAMNKILGGIKKDNLFNNIKSIYILKIIFKNVVKTKYYNIIRYNKKLQNRLDISLNDYKDLYFRSNFIKIIFNKNILITKNTFKFDLNSGHYHFYEEENRNVKKLDINSNICKGVSQINLFIDLEVNSFKRLFYGCEFITKI